MYKTICILIGLLINVALTQEMEWIIAPQGHDDHPGTLQQPFLTLQRALEEAREFRTHRNDTIPLTITVRQGHYTLDEPVILGPEDSGNEKAPLTLRAFPGEQPVFSGGKRLDGWTVQPVGSWQTTIPEARQGKWFFRQIYVNGEYRSRARMPNQGFFRVAGFPDGGRDVHYHTDCQRFQYHPGDIDPNWKNLGDVEVIVYHFWTDSHLPIASIDTVSHIVTFKHKAGKVFTDDFSDQGARYIVENVHEGLDQPGEWILDRHTGVLTYLPMPGETLDTAEIYAPVIHEFLRLQGDPLNRQWVEYIRIQGLEFQHTNWHLPPGNSNDRQGSASVPAAISLTGARHCSFTNCTIRNIGTFAFELSEGCSHNTFAQNTLEHLAAGGFRIDGGTEERHPLLRTGYNTLSDNHLHHFGEVYPSAVGILLQNTFGNTVNHNLIHHGYYTGISIGWEWGYQRSVAWHNRIEYNHIHHIGQGLLSDMGAIYTLGVSPGTVIRNNLIHDVDSHHYGGWGIYNDEGSTHILIENNIVYNTKFSAYNIHFAREITVRNNIFAMARLNQLSRSRVEPHKSVFFENNIVYWTRGELLSGRWQDEPYSFYFHPKNESGTQTLQSTFEMDWNLYFNPHLTPDSLRFGNETFEQWQARGKDLHSVYTDPLFVNPSRYDFRLRNDSPALELGFEPIDMSMVGPRQE
jgi:hypothetical protein